MTYFQYLALTFSLIQMYFPHPTTNMAHMVDGHLNAPLNNRPAWIGEHHGCNESLDVCCRFRKKKLAVLGGKSLFMHFDMFGVKMQTLEVPVAEFRCSLVPHVLLCPSFKSGTDLVQFST